MHVLVLVAVLGQPTPPPTLPKSTTTTTTRPARPGADDHDDHGDHGTGHAADDRTADDRPPPPPSTTATTTPPPAPTTTTTSIPLNDLPIADPFKFARPTTDALLAATEAAVTPVTVATTGQVVGAVTSVWGGVPHPATVVIATSAWLPDGRDSRWRR